MQELSQLVEKYIFGILSWDNNDSDEFAVISFQSNPSRVSRQYALHQSCSTLIAYGTSRVDVLVGQSIKSNYLH